MSYKFVLHIMGDDGCQIAIRARILGCYHHNGTPRLLIQEQDCDDLSVKEIIVTNLGLRYKS